MKTDDELVVHQSSAHELALVGQAMDEGHQVTLCHGCLGPRLHSKLRGIRCIRCGQFWDTSPGWTKRPPCDRCGKPLPMNRRERCLPCALRAYRRHQRMAGVKA